MTELILPTSPCADGPIAGAAGRGKVARPAARTVGAAPATSDKAA